MIPYKIKSIIFLKKLNFDGVLEIEYINKE